MSGTNGRKLTRMPTTTSSSGAENPSFGPIAVAAAMPRSPSTATIKSSTAATSPTHLPQVWRNRRARRDDGARQRPWKSGYPGHSVGPCERTNA